MNTAGHVIPIATRPDPTQTRPTRTGFQARRSPHSASQPEPHQTGPAFCVTLSAWDIHVPCPFLFPGPRGGAVCRSEGLTALRGQGAVLTPDRRRAPRFRADQARFEPIPAGGDVTC